MLQLLDELTNVADRWRPFDRLHRGFADLFTDPFGQALNGERTPINIYANEDALKVVVRAPGWQPEWFDLAVEGSKLYIKGETKHDVQGEGGYAYESLNRMVNLPFRVDANSVQASYANGLLTIDMTRREQDKPRKIAIRTA